jgi:very-short-patch-repair endonuclease
MRLRSILSTKYNTLFPAPVEVRLVEILGGTTLTIGRLRRNGRPMTITLSRGRLLRSRRFRRAVLDGQGILANDVKWAIQILGPEYERDVVAAYERDEWLEEHGWRLGYVRAFDIWNHPEKVRENIVPFIAS